MASRAQRYDLLAGLFEYPDRGDYDKRLDECTDVLAGDYSDAAALLRPLRESIGEKSPAEIEEMYTRTFDINPVCTLEIGWHIYGEDYARGEFLVKMRQELRDKNLPESKELPDHMTHVLSLLGRLEGEQADDLAARYLLPGLDKMLAGMSEKGSPYLPVLETVAKVIRKDHAVLPMPPRERRGDPPGWKNRMPVFGTQGCGGGPIAGQGRKS